MRSFTLVFLGCLLLAPALHAQDFTFRGLFSFEPAHITEAPELSEISPQLPEAARKNGVEGTVKVSFTLGADAKVHNATIVQDLPFGVGEAVKRAVEGVSFTPAALNGKPVDMNASFTYLVSVFYDESDKDIQKVKITDKPVPEYPAVHGADARKGSVIVWVTFYTDGKVAVGRTESTMPNEFDEAAKKAAAKLKFEPAIHKKTKKPVNQSLWVPFDFKP